MASRWSSSCSTRQGLGTLADDLSGRSAESRHHSEPAAGHAGDALPVQQQRQVRHRVACAGRRARFPNPETDVHLQAGRLQDNNNITGVKDKRIDELLAPTTASSTSRSERRSSVKSTAFWPICIITSSSGTRRSSGSPTGTSLVSLRAFLAASTITYSASWLWWIDPEREPS